MIIGIGTDLADIRRIKGTLDRFGDRFIQRCFTEAEQAKAARRSKNDDAWAGTFAKRWAAKEACSKALGTGFRRGVYWRDMGVVNLPGGKPTMALTGGAARRLDEITPDGMRAQIDVSITDEPPTAQVIVIISAVPDAPKS